MEGMELISFNIISNVGSAKSMIMESMEKSRKGDFKGAQQLLEEANKYLVIGEQEHFKIISKEAKKEELINLNVLFMHAEDQLMSTVTLRDIAKEMLEMYKLIYDFIHK